MTTLFVNPLGHADGLLLDDRIAVRFRSTLSPDVHVGTRVHVIGIGDDRSIEGDTLAFSSGGPIALGPPDEAIPSPALPIVTDESTIARVFANRDEAPDLLMLADGAQVRVPPYFAADAIKVGAVIHVEGGGRTYRGTTSIQAYRIAVDGHELLDRRLLDTPPPPMAR